MRTWTLVWKEMRERPVALATCLLAIVLGVTALVAVRTVTAHSELAVAHELDALGANVLILPKGVTLQDYYAADMHGETIPEEYVERITLSKLQGGGQPLPETVRADDVERSARDTDGHLAEVGVPGEGGVGRGRGVLPARRLRGDRKSVV